MEANTQKKETLLNQEPPKLIELDDAVLDSVVGGANNPNGHPNRPPGADNHKHPFPGNSRYAFQ